MVRRNGTRIARRHPVGSRNRLLLYRAVLHPRHWTKANQLSGRVRTPRDADELDELSTEKTRGSTEALSGRTRNESPGANGGVTKSTDGVGPRDSRYDPRRTNCFDRA